MSFYTQTSDRSNAIAEINMVPMIDIMLVLLIIFIITSPLMTHAVKLNLPQENSSVNEVPPQSVMISLDGKGIISINNVSLDREDLQSRLKILGQQRKPPQVQLYVDQLVDYRSLSAILTDLSSSGLIKVAFVSQPAE